MAPLRGALAASVTPLREHGSELDDDAFGPLADFFVREGLDGILALGTAGEGILLSVEERRRVADLFLRACDRRLQVAVHCGAQTTADTVTLAAHAAESRRRRGRRHRPALLQARREGAVRPLLRGGDGVRTAALLRLRVCGDDRLRDRAGGARAPPRRSVERGRPQGLGHAVRGVREVPASRLRHLRRPGGADRGRDGARCSWRSVGARVRASA